MTEEYRGELRESGTKDPKEINKKAEEYRKTVTDYFNIDIKELESISKNIKEVIVTGKQIGRAHV